MGHISFVGKLDADTLRATSVLDRNAGRTTWKTSASWTGASFPRARP
jgi:hypothetical protein